jgi:hypothetical protein
MEIAFNFIPFIAFFGLLSGWTFTGPDGADSREYHKAEHRSNPKPCNVMLESALNHPRNAYGTTARYSHEEEHPVESGSFGRIYPRCIHRVFPRGCRIQVTTNRREIFRD